MPYIGNQPSESFTSFATQEFSTSATTSYTLDHAVTNENEIALFINNVRQQPGSGKAYTATGTALTLSAATASTDTMYCVFLGRALQTVTPATNSITSAMLSGNLVTPGTLDVNGNELILDADADTSITADTDDTIHIKVSNADKITLTSSVFLYGKTSSGTSVDGVEFEDNGKAVFSRSGTSGGTPMFINRNDNDGSIISIRQADSEEGTISVSGSTVSYNAFTGSLQIGGNGIFAYSTLGLSLIFNLGIILGVFSFLISFFYFLAKILGYPFPIGNPTIVISIFFIGAINILSMAIIGQYIERIYEETRLRPRYIIRKTKNID